MNASKVETPSLESNESNESLEAVSAVEPSPLDLIQQGVSALFLPEDVIEVRVPKARGGKKTISGYYNDHAKMAEDLASLDGRHDGIYYTINPVNSALLSRAANRLKSYAATTTSDPDITQRIHLLIDADPARPAGISASDEEKEHSRAQVRSVFKYLRTLNFPDPIVADSGNGFHLIYSINLPNDKDSADLVRAFLKALAVRFNTPQSKIDESVFNASRIVKAYGTVAAKGDNTDERPHRRSQIIRVGDQTAAVSVEQLQVVIADNPTNATNVPSTSTTSSALSISGAKINASNSITPEQVEMFLEYYEIGHHEVVEEPTRYKWILDECPFKSEHTGEEAPKDAAVFLQKDGGLGFKCFHSHCSDVNWKAYRAHIEFTSGKKYWFVDTPQGMVVMGGGKEIPIRNSNVKQPWLSFADFEPEELVWLWPEKLPLGALTVFSGDPSLGKSLMLLDFAARGSVGAAFLDGTANERGVFETILLSEEDDPNKIISPRLIGMGADRTKIHPLRMIVEQNGGERSVNLARDIGILQTMLQEHPDVRLIIIDPLSNYYGGKNANNEQEVRSVLMPLTQLAREQNISIVTVLHNSKQSGRSAMHKTIGAVANMGVARMGWTFRKDPDNNGIKLMLQIKENLGVFPGIKYRTKPVKVTIKGKEIEVAGIQYLGQTDYKADILIAADEDFKTKGDIPAIAFLKHHTKPGWSGQASPLIVEAEKTGITLNMLNKARTALGITSQNIHGSFVWTWPSLKIGGAPCAS